MRRDVDQAIAAISAHQSGAIARSQLYSVGGDRCLVERRVEVGSLIGVTDKVLLVPNHASSLRQRLWLAVLDSEPGAALSHEAAGRLHGLDTFRHDETVVLTAPHGDRRTALADRVHQTRHPREPIVVDGLPVTSVARTIVDLGRILRSGRLETVLDDAVRRRLVRTSQVSEEWFLAWSRWPWRLRTLGQILGSRSPGYEPPRNDIERMLRDLVGDIPGVKFEAPFPSAELPGCCVDALFSIERVILEADGRNWHTRKADFVRDRERDRAASRAGLLTVRYATEEIAADRAAVRAEVDAILAQRRIDLGLAA